MLPVATIRLLTVDAAISPVPVLIYDPSYSPRFWSSRNPDKHLSRSCTPSSSVIGDHDQSKVSTSNVGNVYLPQQQGVACCVGAIIQ